MSPAVHPPADGGACCRRPIAFPNGRVVLATHASALSSTLIRLLSTPAPRFGGGDVRFLSRARLPTHATLRLCLLGSVRRPVTPVGIARKAHGPGGRKGARARLSRERSLALAELQPDVAEQSGATGGNASAVLGALPGKMMNKRAVWRSSIAAALAESVFGEVGRA